MNRKALKTGQHYLVNGVPTDYVSVQERGLQYGDGLFETIACEENGLQFWSAHFSRLQNGAKKLGLVCPPESVLLEDIKRLLTTVSNNHVADNHAPNNPIPNNYVVKIILTRGCSQRGYRMVDKNQLTRIVQVSAGIAERFFSKGEPLQHQEEGKIPAPKMAVLGICEQKISINPSLAGIKHLNRLENVLARNEWRDEYTEGLMLDANGYVIEGTMSNVFGIRDHHLFTPALDNSGIAGIIRANIIESAIAEGIKLEINKFSLDDIYTMDEIFICNSLMEIMPVSKISLNKVISMIAWQLATWSATLPLTTKLNQLLQTQKLANVQYV